MKKLSLADIWSLVRNSFIAVLQGKFILALNPGKYFAQILYTFFLFAVAIWFSLQVENSLAEVERNKQTINELEIIHTHRTFEAEKLSRRTEMAGRLKEMGSDVKEATKPATILK